MRRLVLIATIASALMPVIALATEHETTETRSYATAAGYVTVCKTTEDAGVSAGWGGSCFALDGSKTKATVRIDDLTGPPVQGFYDLLGSDDAAIISGSFCDTGEIVLTAQAKTLRVYVDGIGDSRFGGGCGIGTVGTLTATFS